MGDKICTACEVFQTLANFSIRRASHDGLSLICKDCAKRKSRLWRAANRQRHRDSVRAWQKEHREYVNARSREQRSKNKERRAEVCRQWNERNQDKRAAAVARRRAKLVMPFWADVKVISAFYTEAKALDELAGLKHHVDHIVPINHPLVCGLHVPANLQVIPARINILKRNLSWPDMP